MAPDWLRRFLAGTGLLKSVNCLTGGEVPGPFLCLRGFSPAFPVSDASRVNPPSSGDGRFPLRTGSP